MLHGGQSSFFLQLVNTALLIVVIWSSWLDDTPYILGSFSDRSNIFFFKWNLVEPVLKLLFFKLKKPFSKKNLFLSEVDRFEFSVIVIPVPFKNSFLIS